MARDDRAREISARSENGDWIRKEADKMFQQVGGGFIKQGIFGSTGPWRKTFGGF